MRALLTVAAIVCGAAVATATGGARAAEPEVTLKLHHVLPATAHMHRNVVVPWAQEMAKDSDGRIAIEVYPALQLGGQPSSLVDQVRDGVVDIVWTLPGYTPGRFPIIETFEFPFLTTTTDASSRALWEFYERHAREEFGDIKPLALFMHGPGVFHMRDTEIDSLDDLRGLRVRAPTRLTNKMLAAMGATLVGMPATQVPEAVSRGVIDGLVMPWEVVPGLRLDELTRFHAETPKDFPALYRAIFLFAMNQDSYDRLPDDLKEVIDRNSGLEMSGILGTWADAGDAPGREAAAARGNAIHVFTEEQLAGWRNIQKAVLEDWGAEMAERGHDAEALLDDARALIEKQTGDGQR
jgi:TRAP-type transport system periplasmic protein